jgi:hypothetical protein
MLIAPALLVTAVAAGPGPLAGQDSKPLTLPDLQTDEGALAHLLLSESLTPFSKDYDFDQVVRGMKAIRAIVDNRLHHIPAKYPAKDLDADGAANARDIIGKAKFQGFSLSGGKLAMTAGVQNRIADTLKQANTGKPGKFHKHVQAALDVAKGPPDDAFKGLKMVGTVAVTGRVYAMFQAAAGGGPGGDFVYIGEANGGLLGGNKFYTLKKRD